MKANEAPEKIYIQSFNVSEEDTKFERKLYFDDVWTEEPESGQENIEYIRTDAFIKKATKWLIDNIQNYTDDGMGERSFVLVQDLKEDFKKYMEE